MIVVSDTTPLISLLKINHLELLKELYGTVIIPQAVFSELTSNKEFQSEAEIISGAHFIECKEISDTTALNILQRVTLLDLGESEAIILAQELKADVLLMDENKGRKVAKQLGIPLSGALGVLINSFDIGLLTVTQVKECLEELQRAGRRISGELINSVRSYIGQ
jgi:hypothetical protein